MWVFTKLGHFSLGNDPFDTNRLIVQAERRDEMERLAAVLDDAGGEQHELQPTAEGNYRFLVMAKRRYRCEAVARMVSEIDYGKFVQSVNFDFGSEPGYLLSVSPTGLQVARVRPQ